MQYRMQSPTMAFIENKGIICERIMRQEGSINGAQDRVLKGKDKVKGLLDNIDCSIYPRPPACDMQIDPSTNN